MTAAAGPTTTTGPDPRGGLLWLLLSLAVGLVLAFALAAAVVATQGPQDGGAISNGHQNLVDPSGVLGYGG